MNKFFTALIAGAFAFAAASAMADDKTPSTTSAADQAKLYDTAAVSHATARTYRQSVRIRSIGRFVAAASAVFSPALVGAEPLSPSPHGVSRNCIDHLVRTKL